MRRILHSRLAIAIAASVVTITAIGGITYATSSTNGDAYFACATVSGMIRPSWIRLNTAPDKCPAATDHIVQWAAGGQPIAPKAGIVIPLNGAPTLTRDIGTDQSAAFVYPAVDTSMCASLAVYATYSGTATQQSGQWLHFEVRHRLPGDETDYVDPGLLRADVSGDYGMSMNAPGAGSFSGSGRVAFAANKVGALVGPSTSIAASVYAYSSTVPGVSVTIDHAWLYCTPY